MKHLDLRFYWLRDEVAKGRIEVVHLQTSDMPADTLMKSWAKPKALEYWLQHASDRFQRPKSSSKKSSKIYRTRKPT